MNPTLPQLLLIGTGVAILAIGLAVRVVVKWDRERDQFRSVADEDRIRAWEGDDAA